MTQENLSMQRQLASLVLRFIQKLPVIFYQAISTNSAKKSITNFQLRFFICYIKEVKA